MAIDGLTITGGVTIGNLTTVQRPRRRHLHPPRGRAVHRRHRHDPRQCHQRQQRRPERGDRLRSIPCCPFADAGGGGISNDGMLTLDHTTISDNRADPASGLTSGAIGAGILNRAFGTLTVKHSVVTGNHAAVTPPNGQSADGGGITMVGGTLTMTDSRVSDNSADASSAVPNGVEQNAVAGGIHVQENASATIRRTTITGNSISSTNSVGDANAVSGGLHADGPIVLRDSTISDNTSRRRRAARLRHTPTRAPARSTPTRRSPIRRFTGNRVAATSPAGRRARRRTVPS